jgi:hypothetical protein
MGRPRRGGEFGAEILFLRDQALRFLAPFEEVPQARMVQAVGRRVSADIEEGAPLPVQHIGAREGAE